jgi:hypothetical protein
MIAGGILLLASIAGGIFNPQQFFRSYLMGYLFWIGLPLGAMALIMVQYLTGGAWGVVSRRPLESAMRTLPVLAVLFVPILIGIPWLYGWAHADVVAADAAVRHRQVYMNPLAFIGRAVIYFAIWLIVARLLTKWSDDEDRHGNRLHQLAFISAPGLIVYTFTMTFASVDWAQSLVNNWSSTIWGFLFIVGQALTAMSFAIVVLALLARRAPMSGVVNPRHFHDLGKLLFMFVMLWAYLAFSQLLIVWSGNLTHEIPWYLPGFKTSWSWIGGSLIYLQFLVPFLLLLSRDIKRKPAVLCSVVGIIIGMRFVDLFWIVMPSLHPAGVQVHWLNFSLPLAIGGVWIAAYLWDLLRRPLLPLQAPNLGETLSHARH